MNMFPSPYAAAEVVAVASEYEGGSETLDSRALKSTILEVVKLKDSVFLDTRDFGERTRCRTRVGEEKVEVRFTRTARGGGASGRLMVRPR